MKAKRGVHAGPAKAKSETAPAFNVALTTTKIDNEIKSSNKKRLGKLTSAAKYAAKGTKRVALGIAHTAKKTAEVAEKIAPYVNAIAVSNPEFAPLAGAVDVAATLNHLIDNSTPVLDGSNEAHALVTENFKKQRMMGMEEHMPIMRDLNYQFPEREAKVIDFMQLEG